MPIEIKAVSKEEFDQWVADKKNPPKKAQSDRPRDDRASPRLAADAAG
jgi:heme/copper-type cytochrome/quinol oxidase subunit 2